MSDAPPILVPGRGSGTVDQLLAEPFPRMLMVQTTSACNAHCVFCPLPALRKELPQGRMEQALFERVMAEAGEHKEVACINLFLMNEPLADKHIVQRVRAAHQHSPQAQISLWTNAVNLTPRMTDRLLASPLGSLGVSLHAHTPEAYRRATGRKDFYRVLGNLVHFVEQRLARRPDLALVIRYVDAATYLPEQERQEVRDFWSEGQLQLDIDDGWLGRAGNLEAPAAPAQPHRRLNGCKALGGPKQAHVLYTGQVVLCCMDYRRISNLGDLNEQSLAQIWRGERRRQALEMLFGLRDTEEGFLCNRCELAVPAGEDNCCDPDVPPEDTWVSL